MRTSHHCPFDFRHFASLAAPLVAVAWLGVFGSPARAELGSSFRVSFLPEVPRSSESAPWGMRDQSNRLHLRQLVLERKAVADDGTVTTDELLRTNVLLAPKQTVYIGAGNSEDSEEVLVLIVHAEDFGSR